MTSVVNLHHSGYDVYIGRAGHGQDGYFGNPFVVGLVIGGHTLSRDEILDLYRTYFKDRLQTDPVFKQRVEALRDKVLGCFCKPQTCHGDVIVAYLDGGCSSAPLAESGGAAAGMIRERKGP